MSQDWRESLSSALCPISQSLMTDAVMTCDGHSYSAEAIKKWFERKQNSPITNLPLPSTELRPNYALRRLLAELEISKASTTSSAGAAGQNEVEQQPTHGLFMFETHSLTPMFSGPTDILSDFVKTLAPAVVLACSERKIDEESKISYVKLDDDSGWCRERDLLPLQTSVGVFAFQALYNIRRKTSSTMMNIPCPYLD